MSVTELHIVRRRDINDPDHSGNQVLAFINAVQLLEACCWCSNPTAVEGRDLVQGMATDSLLGRNSLLTLAQVATVLRYFSIIQPKDGRSCYACGGDNESCGFNHLLDWLADDIDRHLGKTTEPAPIS